MVLMAVAAAISGAASALRSYFGVNYYLGVVAVGCLVLLLTIFGAGIVRAASTYMGIAILVTAITIYAIGIFKSESPLFTVLSADFRTTGFANVPKAIFNAFTYAGFQCVTLPTMIACGTTMRSKQGCAKAMWISFVMNAVALVLSVFMLICWRGVYTAVDGGTTIPTLTVCNSMGIRALTAVYGVCLMLCLISTGVTTIFGFVARFEKLPMFRGIQSAPVRSAIVSAFIIILSMSISMAGLTNIIKYGYGYCGYLGIAVVVVPFLTVGVYKNRKYIREHGLAQGFAAAQPEISSIVSALVLLVESAARNAAFCVALVSPLIISLITAYASSYVKSCLSTIFTIASLIMLYTPLLFIKHSLLLFLRVLKNSPLWFCRLALGSIPDETADRKPSARYA